MPALLSPRHPCVVPANHFQSTAVALVPPPRFAPPSPPPIPVAPPHNGSPQPAPTFGPVVLSGILCLPNTTHAALPSIPPGCPPTAAVPSPAQIPSGQLDCPWGYLPPPATDPPAAISAVWPVAPGTTGNCSSDTHPVSAPALTSSPAPDLNAHIHTPSLNSHCRCHPRSMPYTGR